MVVVEDVAIAQESEKKIKEDHFEECRIPTAHIKLVSGFVCK
jgi:hypothetical protein